MLLLLLAQYPTGACSVYNTLPPLKNVTEFELYICTVSTDLFYYIIMLKCFKTKIGKVNPQIGAPYVTFNRLQNITLSKLCYFLYVAIFFFFSFHILHCSWMKSGVTWDATHTVQHIGTIFRYRHQVRYVPKYIASHSSWLSLSYLPMWKPQISWTNSISVQSEIMLHYLWKTGMFNS